MHFATLLNGVVAFLASAALILSANIPVRENAVVLPVSGDSAPLHARGDYQALFCIPNGGVPGQNWQEIDIGQAYITGAIAWIDYGGPGWGNFVSGAGPGYCGQITCNLRSAVYWCNDNLYAISVDSHVLAQMAQYIVDHCKVNQGEIYSGGQLFNSDGYNIIVRDGQCDGDGRKLIKREELIAEIDGRAPNTAENGNENTARASDGIPVDLQCSPELGWEYADYDAVIWGYEYLRDIVQPINVEPAHCLKVFCIGNSGIFICNPSQNTWLTLSSEEVANEVSTIADGCHAGTNTGGQVWDSDGWFVQIYYSPC